MIGCLAAAVALYEAHPSYVHEPPARIRDLLVFIRSVRSICQTSIVHTTRSRIVRGAARGTFALSAAGDRLH